VKGEQISVPPVPKLWFFLTLLYQNRDFLPPCTKIGIFFTTLFHFLAWDPLYRFAWFYLYEPFFRWFCTCTVFCPFTPLYRFCLILPHVPFLKDPPVLYRDPLYQNRDLFTPCTKIGTQFTKMGIYSPTLFNGIELYHKNRAVPSIKREGKHVAFSWGGGRLLKANCVIHPPRSQELILNK